MFPFLFIKEIQDGKTADNFRRIKDYFRSSPLERCQFSFYEITVSGAVTGYTYPHRLGFAPKDVLTLSVSGGATVAWNFDSFDQTNINFTTSGATTIRALIGRYENNG